MAIEPINYMAAMPQQDLLRNIQGGLVLGNQIRQINEADAAQQRAQAAAKLYNDDVTAAINNPTPQAFSALALKYPQQREAIKQAWDGLDAGERKSQGDAMAQSYSALLAGKPEIAKQVVQTRIDAQKNSGRDSSAEENILKLLDSDPKQAQASLGFILSHTTDPQKFAETFGKLGSEQRAQELAPEELKQKRAEATIKAEEAKTASQKFLLDLEQKGWDIQKTQEDIRSSKEGTRLRAMEVALGKERNDISRQELQQKIDDAREKQVEKLREKVSTTESAAASIDNLSNTVDRILKNPELNSVVGSIQGRAPAILSDEAANAISLIEQLGSQAFIAQIPQMKGTGSLSEKEGDKLQASLQNLSRVQGEKQFRYNLEEVQRLMAKARERLSKSTGIPLSAPDRPNAPGRAVSAGPGAPTGSAQTPQRNVVVDF